MTKARTFSWLAAAALILAGGRFSTSYSQSPSPRQANSCYFVSAPPSAIAIAASGGNNLTFSFTLVSGCSWSVTSSFPYVPWITINNPSGISTSSTAPIAVSLNVGSNSSTTVRMGAVNVATVGQAETVQVNQSGIAPLTLSTNGTVNSPVQDVGVASGLQFIASGGVSPYTYSISSGQVPAGETLSSSTGALTGSPTTAGSYLFTVQAKDSSSLNATLSLTVQVLPDPTISTKTLPNGAPSVAYSQTLAAAGGYPSGTPPTGSYTWSIVSGQLPPGLALAAATGVISGTPSTPGTYAFTVGVTDGAASGQQQLSITIGSALSITTTTLPSGVQSQLYGPVTMAASGGIGNYSWTATGLPAGLTLSTAGVLGGTPTAAGAFSVSFTVTSGTVMASATITLTLAATQTITFGPLSNVTAGVAPFTIGATASSGLPVSFASTTTGVCTVSGNTVTIVAAGTCTITASQAGNANYAAATPVSQNFTVTAAKGPLQIPGSAPGAQITLTGGTVAIPYSQILPASNGNPPYSWSVIGGNLPKGLSLSSAGTLSGSPNAAGGAIFTARVTDSAGASAYSGFVMTIAPPAFSITTVSPLPNGIVGSDYPLQVLTASGGNAPYTFTATGGALPGGITFAGGQIGGTPTTAGTFNFTATASDSSSPPLTSSVQLQITVTPSHPDLILSQAALAFSLKLGATGVPAGDSVFVLSSVASQLLNYSVSVSPAAPWLDVTGGGATPGAIGLSIDPTATSLPAGVLTTSVVVTCITPSPCAGNAQNINVSLTVAPAPPQLSVISSLLSFSAQTSSAAISQPLGLQNIGGGSITVNSVTAANSFVTISNVPATIAAGPAVPVTVTVNPSGLAAGFYQSTITVNTSAGLATVPLTLLVAQNGVLTLLPAGAQFQETAGSSPGRANGSFIVGVSGSSTVNWTATLLPGAPWLTLNTPSGSSTSSKPGVVGYSINPAVAATLSAQAYYGAIQVTSSGVVDSPQTFEVVLNVAPVVNAVRPDPQPGGLLFIYTGSALAPQTVQVFASSPTPVTYQASAGSAWLSVSPATGSTSTASPASTSVSVNVSGLTPGIYRSTVSYALSGAAVRSVNVALIVATGATSSDRPKASCVPGQLVPTQTGLVNNFSQPTSWPTPLAVLLADNCGNPVPNGQIQVIFNNGDSPLILNASDATSGIYSGTWLPGNTSADLTITASAAATGFPTAIAQIAGQVTPNAAPVLTANGTLNAFAIAGAPGAPVAPGMIVQIYGSNLAAQTTSATTIPLPTSLNQTQVSIGGILAPLYYVSPGQINAQVPFELQLPASGAPVAVYVSANGALSNSNSIQVTSDAPGIAQFYTGDIIAQHVADYSLVTETSPAKPGEYVVLYVAGMGLTNQTVVSGTASPSTNLGVPLDAATLTLNGAPVTNVPFFGLTPTLVGLYQVDLQVPASAPNGDLVLVLTQSSGQSSSAILPVHN